MLFARLRHAPWEPAVFPLADDAGALLCGGLPLRDLQAREAAAHDGRALFRDVPADGGDALPADTGFACALDCAFSAATLAALAAAAARAPGRVVQACVKRGTPLFTAATRMITLAEGDLPLPLWAGPLGGLVPQCDAGDAADAFPDAVRVPVCDEDGAVVARVPPYGRPPHELLLPRVQKLGGRLRHWLDVLELSLAASATARLAGKNQFRGDVDVHPTATVINSILEDGVRLEANTSVIDSWLGKDVLVADHSVIHTSVIGEQCRTLVDTSLRRVVAMPGCTLSNLGINDVVVGRGVFLTTSVGFFVERPGEDVVVEGHDTGRATLGGALGARCILGSRALMKAGTALPPGLLVVARPEEAAAKIDDAGLARATMIRGNPRDNC